MPLILAFNNLRERGINRRGGRDSKPVSTGRQIECGEAVGDYGSTDIIPGRTIERQRLKPRIAAAECCRNIKPHFPPNKNAAVVELQVASDDLPFQIGITAANRCRSRRIPPAAAALINTRRT